MKNDNDSFERIAEDAVDLLLAVIEDLAKSDDAADRLASYVLSITTADFCFRALAIQDRDD